MRLCTALLLALAACGPSQPASYNGLPLDDDHAARRVVRTPLQRDLDAYIDAIGENWGDAYRLSGYVHVTRGSQVLYSRGFGYADRQTLTENTADTSFRIGSVTKQFTAAAILVLEQQGKLSVTDTVAEHLPDYPKIGADVTIHQLLTHTSGIPSYTSLPELMAERDSPHTVKQIVDLFSKLPLEFEPGSKFSYSNSGYFLLGAIIEAVSGRSYADALQTELFAPAGLKNTAVGDVGGNRALGYEPGADDDELEMAHAIDMSVPFAAGAVRSTANDLVRWHRAITGDKILTAQSRRKLFQVEPATGGAHYAYGWTVQTVDGKRVVSHSGGIDGFSTQLSCVPDDDVVIVVWSNNTGVQTKPIADAALAAVMGKSIEPPVEPEPARLEMEVVAKLIGSYRLSDDSRKTAAATGLPAKLIDSIDTVVLSRATQGISMKPKGQPAAKLRAIEGGSFYNRASGVRVEPSFDADGSVSRLRLTQGALSLDYVPQ